MPKLTITEAVKVIPVSESKLRRDMKAGVVSCEVDEKGKKHFDTSELRRVYGELAMPENNGQVKDPSEKQSETRHDSTEIILLENQVADLRAQLEKTESQLDTATAEKAQLLDLLSAEKDEKRVLQEEKRALMPPVDDKPKSRNWLLRLVGAR